MLPRYILMGGEEAYLLNVESLIFYPSLTGAQLVSLKKNYIWGKVSIDPYNFCLSCVLFLFCLKQGFRISSQLLSSLNEVCFSGVINPKLKLIVKMKVFLKKVHIFGFIDQTYKSVEDRMTHHKVIVIFFTFP